MNKKNENMSLQEATIKALYNELDDSDEIRDVEGVVDDVLVITDPEITKDEYEEVIERAQEIVEDTPEGDIPFDEDYLGQYLQTCPICGSSFVEDHLLEPGATCPICLEQPEAFVVVGKIDSDVAIEEELGLGDEDEVTNEFDTGSEFDLGRSEVEEEPTDVEPTPDVEEEPNENFERSGGRRASNLRLGRDVASKELPSGNILAENKEVITEARYKVSSYYGLNYRGLEDSLETDDYDEARNFVWDKVQKGGAVELVDTETGDRKRFVSKTSEQDETAIDIEDYEDTMYSKATENKETIGKNLTEGLRDIDRESDKWYLNMGMVQSLSNMSDEEIEHYATWQEYAEINDIIKTDDDLDTKIAKLNELKDSIDYKVRFAVDYGENTQESIDKWIKYYKDYIDSYIRALELGDKYYISVQGSYWVFYNDERDDEPFGFCVKVKDGKFEKGVQYYNTEEEAENAMNTLSKSDIANYLEEKYGSNLLEWNIDVFKADLNMLTSKHLVENKEVITEKKIVIDNLGETYTLDTDAKTYTIKTANGEKTFPFKKMDEFIKQYRGVNRIYKPFSLLAYTDYKHGNLKEWDVVGGKELVESVEVNDSDVCDINLDLSKKGEVKDTVKLAIKGIEHTTDKISNAIQTRFGGVYKSDVTGKTYTQDIRVADDLWLTFLYYDDATKKFWFVLDGDISRDPELVSKNQESKKKQ